jgi:hypothetical protein
VCGVPKTIDNDIDMLDRSFGFDTAVSEAQVAIRSAQTEARCNLPNGDVSLASPRDRRTRARAHSLAL